MHQLHRLFIISFNHSFLFPVSVLTSPFTGHFSQGSFSFCQLHTSYQQTVSQNSTPLFKSIDRPSPTCQTFHIEGDARTSHRCFFSSSKKWEEDPLLVFMDFSLSISLVKVFIMERKQIVVRWVSCWIRVWNDEWRWRFGRKWSMCISMEKCLVKGSCSMSMCWMSLEDRCPISLTEERFASFHQLTFILLLANLCCNGQSSITLTLPPVTDQLKTIWSSTTRPNNQHLSPTPFFDQNYQINEKFLLPVNTDRVSFYEVSMWTSAEKTTIE